MKNYLSLSNIATAVKQIIPASSNSRRRREREMAKRNAFVVSNSDVLGLYTKRLMKEMNKYPNLKEISKALRDHSLKHIEVGNLIVFGESKRGVNYDFRVVKNAKILDHLDGREFETYDIIDDFNKIIKKLRTYVLDNSKETEEEYICVAKTKKAPKVRTFDVVLTPDRFKKSSNYTVNLAIISPTIKEQKVTIFDNWVKVGYNQYDIYTNFKGEEFIYVDRHKFFIEKDRFGRKYLID
jgi:hypothetical protein